MRSCDGWSKKEERTTSTHAKASTSKLGSAPSPPTFVQGSLCLLFLVVFPCHLHLKPRQQASSSRPTISASFPSLCAPMERKLTVSSPAPLWLFACSSRMHPHSVRKERKVRPGFTPAEDVTRFRSSRMRAADEFERSRTVPGSGGRSLPGATTARSIPGAAPKATPPTKAAKLNEADAPDAWDDEPVKKASTPAKPNTAAASIPPKQPASKDASSAPAAPEPAASAAEQDPVKRQKALAKKIRAAEALRQKERDGEALLPEQKDKVDSIEALEKELSALGI